MTSVVACCWFSQGLYCAFGTYYTFGKAVSFSTMIFIGDVICYGTCTYGT